MHPCAINLGRRPTFYEHADHSLLEAHLLDFNDDLYGERAEVRFAEFLRSERKFDGVDALVAQLKHDIEPTRRVLDAIRAGSRPLLKRSSTGRRSRPRGRRSASTRRIARRTCGAHESATSPGRSTWPSGP